MGRKLLLPLKIDRWDSYFFNKKIARLTISSEKANIFFAEGLKALLVRAK